MARFEGSEMNMAEINAVFHLERSVASYCGHDIYGLQLFPILDG
jgi:hypothetical protein